MAELFAKQGHPDRAADIYRKMVRDDPSNAHAKQRLGELEGVPSTTPGGPMSFREQIQRIVDSTPGALACTIMGFDGIAIDTYEVSGGTIDITTLLLEYAAAAHQLRRGASEDSANGTLVEITVHGTKLSALVRPLVGEYFLGVVLKPSAIVGKARYLMRIAAADIAKDLV